MVCLCMHQYRCTIDIEVLFSIPPPLSLKHFALPHACLPLYLACLVCPLLHLRSLQILKIVLFLLVLVLLRHLPLYLCHLPPYLRSYLSILFPLIYHPVVDKAQQKF